MVRRSSAVAALACMCVLGLSSVANAQGSRKDDIVFNAQGRPMAGATVRICTSSATGQPCSPLANIYSDSGLTQALANPISTDGLGNYSFYAAPGRYTVEISGPNIATKQIPDVILPNDPSAPTFSSVTSTSGISAFSLSLSGNLTVTGSAAVTGALTAAGSPVATTALPNTWTAAQTFSTPVTLSSAGLQGGNVAAKADNTQNVRYVIGNGNDANDGLSMGSGKLSLYGALVDLIDNAGTLNTSGGAIHYASSRADYGPTLSAPFGTVAPGIYSGIWIMGSNDPNYVTASTLTRSGGTLTITTNATVPSSPYYTPGMTITLFAAGDPSYDGNCTIASAGSIHTSSYNGRLLTPARGRRWAPWNIVANSATLAERPDGTAQLFLGNGAANGKIYQLSDSQLSDDGAAISGYYTTYFLPGVDDEQQLQTRAHRKLFSYLTCYVEGAGNLNLTVFPVNQAFPASLPQLPLSSPGGKDLELPINVLAERAAFQFGTSQPGAWFRLARLVTSLAPDPWSPVRGGN